MKNKILFISLILLTILVISGCGKTEDITGNAVKDTEQDTNLKQDIPLKLVQNSFTDETCSFKKNTGNPIFDCESSVINKDKITIKLRALKSGYKSIKRIYFPKIEIDGCELNIVPSLLENAMKYDDTRVFEIPCNIKSEIIDTEFIVEYIGYEPKSTIYKDYNITEFDIENEEQGKFVIFDGKIEGALRGSVR